MGAFKSPYRAFPSWRAGREAAIGAGRQTYAQKVLSYGPIAYWIQGEAAGVTAVDQVNSPAQDGTYTGVTLGQPGIGDGNTCPLYDGTNDYTDVHSATFAGAFDGAEGSAFLWLKMSGAGAWTDAAERRALTFRADADNRVIIGKSDANNTLRWAYEAGNVIEVIDVAGYSTTDWFSMCLTWSAAADEVKGFFNGSQVGITQTILGVWAGSLSAATTLIGALSKVPQAVTSGNIAHCAIWDRALSPAEIADLAVL